MCTQQKHKGFNLLYYGKISRLYAHFQERTTHEKNQIPSRLKGTELKVLRQMPRHQKLLVCYNSKMLAEMSSGTTCNQLQLAKCIVVQNQGLYILFNVITLSSNEKYFITILSLYISPSLSNLFLTREDIGFYTRIKWFGPLKFDLTATNRGLL